MNFEIVSKHFWENGVIYSSSTLHMTFPSINSKIVDYAAGWSQTQQVLVAASSKEIVSRVRLSSADTSVADRILVVSIVPAGVRETTQFEPAVQRLRTVEERVELPIVVSPTVHQNRNTLDIIFLIILKIGLFGDKLARVYVLFTHSSFNSTHCH